MKTNFFRTVAAHCLLALGTPIFSTGQACEFQPPAVKIDFGNIDRNTSGALSVMRNYRREGSSCPDDGSYSLTSATADCFGNHWLDIPEDHTAGDVEGNMLLINSSFTPGVFFVMQLNGIQPNARYEFSTFLMNVCEPDADCTGQRPNLRFTIEDANGRIVAQFSTGSVPMTGQVAWRAYKAMFQTPAITERMVLKIANNTPGGCGNDFAIDDIVIRECRIPPPPVVVPPVKEIPKVAGPLLPAKKPVAPASVPVVKQPQPTRLPMPAALPKDSTQTARIEKKPPPVFVPPPPLIVNRANPVVKTIETGAETLQIDLYDNGDIDGDTVTIYHNNQLVVARAALTAKAVSFQVPVNREHPHHEIVMVANNLGSIPPNTSLMVITAGTKRYEVFISSTEQKNAKIVIELKE